jgi:hypothetical protein
MNIKLEKVILVAIIQLSLEKQMKQQQVSQDIITITTEIQHVSYEIRNIK